MKRKIGVYDKKNEIIKLNTTYLNNIPPEKKNGIKFAVVVNIINFEDKTLMVYTKELITNYEDSFFLSKSARKSHYEMGDNVAIINRTLYLL